MRLHILLKSTILCLFVCTLCSHLSRPEREVTDRNNGHSWEEYQPSFFYKYQSINDIITDLNGHFSGSKLNSLEYFDYAADIIRKRFYHGYCYYHFSENPFAFLSGKLFWTDLAAIVNPDDIMKHPMAACSQQSIVLAEIFKRQGIPYREVGYDHHFTIEGWIGGDWRYFDTDLEPDFHNKRVSLKKLIDGKTLEGLYTHSQNQAAAFASAGRPFYGATNAPLAPKAMIFYHITSLLNSQIFLASVYLLLVLFPFVKVVRARKTTSYLHAALAAAEPTMSPLAPSLARQHEVELTPMSNVHVGE